MRVFIPSYDINTVKALLHVYLVCPNRLCVYCQVVIGGILCTTGDDCGAEYYL